MTARESARDINPYAPPSVPDPLLPERVPSGGAWRDGRLLVVHRRGCVLPPICLLTGEPGDVRRTERVEWWYMIDVARRLAPVQFSLSLRADQSNRRWRRAGVATMIAAPVAFVTAVLLSASNLISGLPVPLWFIACLLAVAVGGIVYSVHAPLLRFQRVRGEFLWIQGAHPRFLACLPQWPGQ